MARSPSTPTAADVARRAGVSQAAVSYVLSGRRAGKDSKPGISAETRARILAAVAELGYVPNHTARSLRRGRAERVSLVLPGLGIPFHDALVRDLQRVGEAHGYTLIVTIAGSPERQRQALLHLRRRLADGVVIVGDWPDEGMLAPLVEAGIAVVAYHNHLTPVGFDVVRTTEGDAGYEATRYLLDRGRCRIAFLGTFGSPPAPDTYARFARYDRFMAYLRALRELGPGAGAALDPALVVDGAGTRRTAYDATRALLALPDRPTAIVAAADIAAAAVIAAVYDAGLAVPDDVAVVGAGNIPEGETTRPPLTTIGPAPLDFTPVAELLFGRLGGDAPPGGRTHRIPWSLIRRGSA